MPDRDPRFVHLASSLSEADLLVTTLTSNGVPARVIDRNTAGGTFGLTLMGSRAPGEVEVWVDDPAQVEEAQSIIEELRAIVTERAERAAKPGTSVPIELTCDRCGKQLVFPPEAWGTVQECGKCGNFLDVGDAGEELDWDVGVIDEEEEPEAGN